ncbi:PREDICTED: frataxin, mitochondrial [Camelina sativa]|uniref:ferroxidase n=1 Tax=Camelina sativa TaxID=90675 RepID=A0ABM0TSW7_CAMSA|nr:PREDICTED: frataxin, mitochondrial [Camelina sativa]
MATASRFLRKLPRFLKLSPTLLRSNGVRFSSNLIQDSLKPLDSFGRIGSRIRNDYSTTRSFSSSQGPASVDYSSVLQEDEFHKLANFTINDLLAKIEDYGDDVQIDGFDIDYGNEVLTLKLGSLGTYVLNKQTPNRQIWMSSPVSGPSRFDWDRDANAWIYRRTEAKLHKLLEEELENLCGEPIQLS